MPEGINHAPAQKRASDAKARVLIFPRLTIFSLIYPVLLSIPDVTPTQSSAVAISRLLERPVTHPP
jgi:hypothetical protein